MAKIVRYLSRILINNNNNNSTFMQRNIRPLTIPSIKLNDDATSANYEKSLAVHNIERSLNVQKRIALKLVNENQKLITISPRLISENHEILLENKLVSSTALRYPFLLWSNNLGEKISLLKKLNYPLDVTIVLAGSSRPMLGKIICSGRKFEERIHILSQLFKVSPRDTCELLYKKDFLITRNLETIKEILNILREFGITLEDIRKDPWVLRYSQATIKDRIKYITDTEVELLTPKPWMLRSPTEVIENYFKRRQDNRQILGSASLTEYLSKKLECAEDQAKYLISKMPALRTKSLRTLSEIINFLYSKGFQSYHIYRVPKILVHSVETTKKRLELIENAGIQIDSLYMLTKSQKQFMQNFEAMLKTKRTV
ncbi:transcription termination factor, mitochondrial [Coccinella septempunctata]|uniref:transcription termination factor, mitochondrial n=1 Tax=Coccinella septempunctata TaxID=41139 RepID=UPI001D07C65D|nr:transcription termination factor, mitochondrial [Coccinella septempunctata]